MPMHASVRRLLAHFNYVDPRSPALCAHFAALAQAIAQWRQGPETTVALQTLLVARDWGLRADERRGTITADVNDVSELLDDDDDDDVSELLDDDGKPAADRLRKDISEVIDVLDERGESPATAARLRSLLARGRFSTAATAVGEECEGDYPAGDYP